MLLTRRRFLATSAAFGAAGLTGCQSVDVGNLVEGAVYMMGAFGLDENFEIQMGDKHYASLIEQDGGPYPNAAVQAAVQEVAQPLFALSRVQKFKWEVTVTNNDTVNAWALPGGKIGINRGLIRYVDCESELAAVIAHEMGHAEQHHVLEQTQDAYFFKGVSQLGREALAAGTKNRRFADNVVDELAIPIFNTILGGYPLAQEKRADKFIVTLFKRTRHDPIAASNFFYNLLEITPPASRQRTSLYSTHPETLDRIRTLLKLADKWPLEPAPTTESFRAALKRALPTRKFYKRKIYPLTV
jgi:predicted Zn-dependent protease